MRRCAQKNKICPKSLEDDRNMPSQLKITSRNVVGREP